jgi:malate synthase
MKKEILSADARLFLDSLSNLFTPKIKQLLQERKQRKNSHWKHSSLGFLKETREIRDSKWEILGAPKEIEDRRVEITGPPVRKMIINALNSGANVFMADFEDSNCPTWENCLQGQENLREAVQKNIEYTDPTTKKNYKLKDQTAVLFVRPRGLHLVEKNYVVDGDSISASLFDYGLFFFHNYKKLLKNGSRPYFYLPKIEHYKEARVWDEIFTFSEKAFDLPLGTIRATVLIETLPAAFQMNEILYELRAHSAGLNCGRWDYIFSFIKSFQFDRGFVLPDRSQITMGQHFLRSYSQLLVQTCHKRGAHAIGGMAAQIPIKNDENKNAVALAKVMADKDREVKDGHDGTWVAHPGLVYIAKGVFDACMETPNQIHKQIYLNDSISKEDLLCIPKGTCTEEGFRNNIRIGFQYLNSWLNGNGCVPINNLMEDAATAEISRTQIWQWLKYNIWLDNGKQVTKKYFFKIFDEELQKFENNDKLEKTKEIFIKLCTSKKLIDFLTLECYDTLS